MLGRLSREDQDRLIAAMSTIERLLGAAPEHDLTPERKYILRAPTPGDFGWIVKRHAEIYGEEYGWTAPFEGVCAQIVADFANTYDAKRERCWIAEMDGENVGSIFLAKRIESVARIRLFWWTRKRAGSASVRASPTNHPLRAARRLQENHAMDPQRARPRRATSTRRPASS